MNLIHIYECFCDRTRLRILHLLSDGALCVCHIQEILGETQVTVSKRLAYLKRHGLVEAKRHANWMYYSLAVKQSPVLKANLACLQDCVREEPVFRRDSANLKKLRARLRVEEMTGLKTSGTKSCDC